jgi:hypothetical protein
MNLTAVSIRLQADRRAAERLLERRAPIRIGSAESNDQEYDVQAGGNRFLQGTIRLPRNPLFPISSNRSTAPAGNNDRHACGTAPVALIKELHSPDLDAASGREKPPNILAPAESFLPSKAFSHQRLSA